MCFFLMMMKMTSATTTIRVLFGALRRSADWFPLPSTLRLGAFVSLVLRMPFRIVVSKPVIAHAYESTRSAKSSGPENMGAT